MDVNDIDKNNKDLQFGLIVESIPNAIIIVNKSGIITLVNRQTETLFGYSKPELIGQQPEILIPEKYKTAHPHFRNLFFQNKEFRQMGAGRDLFAVKKDGTEFPVEIGLNPIETSEGTSVLASIIDISERKNIELEKMNYILKIEEQNNKLIESEQKLKSLNATKDKLFSIIGHDLRGSIGGFKSLIEMLLTNFDLTNTKELTKILTTIKSSTNKTYELLENLLLWSKNQQSETKIYLVKVSLFQVVGKCISLLSELEDSKQITIKNLISENDFIIADIDMILTIFRNLISNAIKFSQNGKSISISSTTNQSEIIISINDEGVGIDPADISKIFNTGEHYTTYGTLGEKGSGLGLLLCKDFVEKLGGKIWVESELGKGSKFKFTMPLCID